MNLHFTKVPLEPLPNPKPHSKRLSPVFAMFCVRKKNFSQKFFPDHASNGAKKVLMLRKPKRSF